MRSVRRLDETLRSGRLVQSVVKSDEADLLAGPLAKLQSSGQLKRVGRSQGVSQEKTNASVDDCRRHFHDEKR
jgi:hypothetical protein